MPGKKRKTKGSKSSMDRSRNVSRIHPNAKHETTDNLETSSMPESQFSGFLDGLLVTSSPGNNQYDERRNILLQMANEQRRVVEDAIKLRFDPIIEQLDGLTAVWDPSIDLLDAAQSLIDAKKADDAHYSGTHGSHHATESRKVTWAETPHPRERTGLSRDTRRSKSVDPGARYGATSQTLSSGISCPDLKTPGGAERFHFNIATVTPHPERTVVSNPTILRKPKFGETAISMAGSPLLVSSDHVLVPSVVVPLADGRVFTVQGNSGTFKEKLRDGLDTRTIDQLKQLKNFMNDLVP